MLLTGIARMRCTHAHARTPLFCWCWPTKDIIHPVPYLYPGQQAYEVSEVSVFVLLKHNASLISASSYLYLIFSSLHLLGHSDLCLVSANLDLIFTLSTLYVQDILFCFSLTASAIFSVPSRFCCWPFIQFSVGDHLHNNKQEGLKTECHVIQSEHLESVA